jgi:hypothetical protein
MDRDAAWKFIGPRISLEMALRNAKVGGQMPSRKSTCAEPGCKTAEAEPMRSWRGYILKRNEGIRYPRAFVALPDLMTEAAQAVITNRRPAKERE